MSLILLKMKKYSNVYAKRKESIKYFSIHPVYLLSPWINHPRPSIIGHFMPRARSLLKRSSVRKRCWRTADYWFSKLYVSFACLMYTAIRKSLLLLLQLLRLPEADTIKGKVKNNGGKGQISVLLVQTKKLTVAETLLSRYRFADCNRNQAT